MFGRKNKPHVVDLGGARSFTVKYPGALTRAARRAGMTNLEFEEKHKHDKGVTGARARSGLGFRAMKH